MSRLMSDLSTVTYVVNSDTLRSTNSSSTNSSSTNSSSTNSMRNAPTFRSGRFSCGGCSDGADGERPVERAVHQPERPDADVDHAEHGDRDGDPEGRAAATRRDLA